MGQMQRISKNNTKITSRSDGWDVRLYNTVVIRRVGNVVTIDTGGYKTATTRARINQVCNEYDLPFRVGVHKGDFFLAFHSNYWGERAQAHHILESGAMPDRHGRFYFDETFFVSLIGDES